MSKQKRELKPEQTAAAQTLDRHISVTAGPGSGKTTVLVERYLHILRQNKNLGIDQIVAITFTNRAANEMRERLRVKLDEMLETAAPAERRRWVGYKRTLDGAIITTIHGFCARLLRDFPVEAGIDPQFTLLDEHQAAVLLEAAVEESLTEFITSDHQTILRLAAGVGRGRVAAALVELYRTIRGQGLSITKLAQQTIESHSTWEQYCAEFTQLEARMNDLITARRLPERSEEKRIAGARGWSELKGSLLDQQLPLGEFCRRIAEFREVARPDARGPVGPIVKQLDEYLWGEKREKGFGLVPSIRFDLAAGEYAAELINVLQRVNERLEEKKRQLSALDFDDLQLRALKLLDRPEVVLRAARRYKFFLVDEFQDTNSIQRDLLERLALKHERSANLFIVGDRKQSIYGFRGADVDVFREMTAALIAGGGQSQPLNLNFRSQPPLIGFFNLLFKHLFESPEDLAPNELAQLGYVEHEASIAEREPRDPTPLVELMVATPTPGADMTSRELDANQAALRIASLVQDGSNFKYGDIALLFRALTDVPVYEAQFRRAHIPYQTVQGKGFYEREEITDLIQLLRFLDNTTDELALAAVLRSPLGGISDNTLLALRLAPRIAENGSHARRQPRNLFHALRIHREIAFIEPEEHKALERVFEMLQAFIERRNRYAIGDLLRDIVAKSEFVTVISATFDGAQRLANVEKLFTLAERFERSGAYLIRDFVKYVHDFEAIGSRESEGEMDESADAVKLMTIHQAKGLEFPVVLLPDLHRSLGPRDNWVLLDRHLGLTLRIPNGRGEHVAGNAFRIFGERVKYREEFESMRLLYVAATRARDRLILSGVTEELARLAKGRDNWLKWIWQALELQPGAKSGIVELADNVSLRLTLNLGPESILEPRTLDLDDQIPTESVTLDRQPEEIFTLLKGVAAEQERLGTRFNVTQLINYQRCPRQYYFDRVLRVPTDDERSVWNDAEAPEPPANLTATLKGAVIHRFCDIYTAEDNFDNSLERSFLEVITARRAQFADRLLEIDPEEALEELAPLARNYASSKVFERIERARRMVEGSSSDLPVTQPGLWSELPFRLRRPLGILTGTVDKLLIVPAPNRDSLDIEIVDFKTNRIVKASRGGFRATVAVANQRGKPHEAPQLAFDFSAPDDPLTSELPGENDHALTGQVEAIARDYQLQMQAYALAVHELLGDRLRGARIKVTLHFLDPDLEFELSPELLEPGQCARAIDEAMSRIISAKEPKNFGVRPDSHCRLCNYLGVCAPGREWLSRNSMEGRKPA